jgi:hypothetical protein
MVDNEFLGLHFGLKRIVGSQNDRMNLELLSKFDVNTSCPIPHTGIEERYWKKKMLPV